MSRVTIAGWRSDVRVTAAAGFSGPPKMSPDAAGNLGLAFTDTRNGNPEVYFAKLDNLGNAIGPQLRLTNDAALSWFPSMGRDANGNLHVVWTDERDGNAEVYYTKLDPSGNTLVDDLRLTTDAAASIMPSLAVDAAGNVHLAWVDARDGNPEIYYGKLDSSGGTLVADTRLTADGAISTQAAITADASSNVHILWTDDRDGNSEIYYTKLDTAGATLVDDTRVTTDAGDSSSPRATADASNNVHLAWLDTRDGNPEIYYKKLDSNGNALTADLRQTTDASVSWFPSLLVDSSGNVLIAWADARAGNLEIYYTKLDNAGAVLKDDTLVTSEAGDSLFPVLAMDANKNLHLAWTDARDGNEEVYYKTTIRPPGRSGSPLFKKVLQEVTEASGTSEPR